MEESDDDQWVYDIDTYGAYNYRTVALSGSQFYAVTKMLYFTQNDVHIERQVELEIQTGRRGTTHDAAGTFTLPTEQILEGRLGTGPSWWGFPAGGLGTPMFTQPGYSRFQFTTQTDLMAFVTNIATSPKAHLFLLGDLIDDATGAPFGKT